jgi:hypothetical protein
MSLDTYTNLKTAIARWTGRADQSSDIDDFIDMFEAWCNRNLRCAQMENEATATGSEYLALPGDFLELRDIQYQTSPVQQLEYVTPSQADGFAANTTRTLYYTIVGGQFRLIGPPSGSTLVRIDYYQAIPALSGSQATNWLLTQFPDAYLFGSLVHGAALSHDDPRMQTVLQAFAQIVAEIQQSGKKRKLGPDLSVRVA